jgi:pimeloyl-ACP methyl ester carboxylesterase
VRRLGLRRVSALLAAAGIAGATLSWIAASLIARPTPHGVPDAYDAEKVRLATADGVSLAGWHWPAPGAPGVLLLHGNGASRAMHLRRARWLHGAGFAVLAIDFRGHGESTPRPRSFGWFESRDARAAFDWLKRRQHGASIGIVGVSLGGAAALLGERGPLPADALVLEGVYPNIRDAIRNRVAAYLGPAAPAIEPVLSLQSIPRYGIPAATLSPQRAAAGFDGPAMVIGGGEDRYTPPAETRALFDVLPGPKSLWLVPGAGHDDIVGLSSDEYRRRLVGFFDRHLRPARP